MDKVSITLSTASVFEINCQSCRKFFGLLPYESFSVVSDDRSM